MHPAPQKTRDDVVRQLAVASVSGTLVLFVGSGFSKALTAGAAPTWGQLLQRVAKRVGLADPLDDPSTIVGVSFPQLANKMAASLARSVAAEERFQASSAEDHYAEAVRRIKEAASRETASVEPDAKVLERFKAAFGKLAPVAVVTTNYDFLIEACLDHAEMLLPNQVFRSRRDCVPVLHLHGSLRHPESIVLLEGDYVQALDAREYRHVRLGVLFAENTTLMLGYALGDLNVRTALAAAAAYRNPSAELRSSDVGQVVVLNRTECPSDSARHGRNGEWVIEEAEIVTLLEAIAEQREKVHKSWTASKARVTELLAEQDAPERFASDQVFRRGFIGAASKIPALLGASETVQFMQRALTPVAERAWGINGWTHYETWLAAVLDVLEHWPMSSMPPLLFEYVAMQLASLALMIGSSEHDRTEGKAYQATRLWYQRQASIFDGKPMLVAALRSHAERIGYLALTNLLPDRAIQ